MRGLKRLAFARIIAAGHAFVQNVRRGHYALTADLPLHDRARIALDDLAPFPLTEAMRQRIRNSRAPPATTQQTSQVSKCQAAALWWCAQAVVSS
jgi:hypothetical protein